MSPTSTSAPPARPGVKASSVRDELGSLRIDRSKARKSSPLALLAWLLLGIVIIGAIAAAGFVALKDRLFPPTTVTVESVRVMTLGQAQTELTCTGYLESRWQAAVGAKVPGRISEIPVEEGTQVKAGDVLAELEHADLDAMLASRKVAVALAEAQLAEAKFNAEQVERDYAREQDVFKRNAGTKSALEKSRTARDASKSILQAREASVAAAKNAVREAEESIRNMFIYAPFDGTVVTKDAEKGESIMPGGMGASSGRGSVITLAKLDELEVDTDVKEDYLAQIHKGQPTEVVVDAVPDRRYRGELREIIPMGDRTRGIVKVKVAILNPDERLFPELSATVNFLPDQKEGEASLSERKAVFAPLAAIQGEGSEKFAWVVNDNRVRKVAVTTTGEPEDNLIEIASPFTGGESLVTSPPPGLKDGEQIQVAE
ncbi:efflux RND transporter periplasmic adaptor subunit [Lacipirellula limnantheis]|uniref:Multidrug resistance protein MdtA n=1 Tax=Lacipirellula limnantheis TaxID=2528024 RepID=A0A517TVB8_9BACT|nr:efflux RND transporter periplasmic adaptor subunit [Lacipirellula limnantheis]QDT72326.1 Multidrug resistance protein MdtA precursor [Lacipirellula limnantheis]